MSQPRSNADPRRPVDVSDPADCAERQAQADKVLRRASKQQDRRKTDTPTTFRRRKGDRQVAIEDVAATDASRVRVAPAPASPVPTRAKSPKTCPVCPECANHQTRHTLPSKSGSYCICDDCGFMWHHLQPVCKSELTPRSQLQNAWAAWVERTSSPR